MTALMTWTTSKLSEIGVQLNDRTCVIDTKTLGLALSASGELASLGRLVLQVGPSGKFGFAADRDGEDLDRSYLVLDPQSKAVSVYVSPGAAQPICFSEFNGKLAFGRVPGDLISILKQEGQSLCLSKDIALSLIFLEISAGNQTLIEQIQLVHMGERITWSLDPLQKTVDYLWSPRFDLPELAELDGDLLVKRLCELLETLALPSDEAVLAFSGGMDSRFILGMLLKKGIAPLLYTFQYGRSLDIKLASKVADWAGLDLLHCKLTDDDYLVHANEYILRSGGGLSLAHTHAAVALRHLPPKMQALGKVYGHLGDQLMGDFQEKAKNLGNTPESLFEKRIALLEYGPVLMKHSLRERFISEVEGYVSRRVQPTPDRLCESFGFVMSNHGRLNYIFEAAELQGDVYRPFANTRLMDFSLGMPRQARKNRAAFDLACKKMFPELFEIPTTKDLGDFRRMADLEARLEQLTFRLPKPLVWQNQFNYEQHHILIAKRLKAEFSKKAEVVFDWLGLPMPDFDLDNYYKMRPRPIFRVLSTHLLLDSL